MGVRKDMGLRPDAGPVMRQADAWRDVLSGEAEERLPLLVAWTAWRWADTARRIVEAHESTYDAIVVLTLLAHARILLDMLDAGHVASAVALHADVTQGAERLDAPAATSNPAFLRWATPALKRAHGATGKRRVPSWLRR